MAEPTTNQGIFAGLRQLAESAFPKRCAGCGHEYATAMEFIAATHALHPRRSGLKQSRDDDENLIVDLFRNCECGSTLMESFHDRRDLTAAGIKRRRRFDEMLGRLVASGMDKDVAQAELLKLMRGQSNDLLRLLRESAVAITAVGSNQTSRESST